jgi:glycolate oxidase FAD binding subunit
VGVIDLHDFAAAVGHEGPVTIEGLGTRGGGVDGVRAVHAPSGIDWLQADEMTVCCGAGTPVDQLQQALAEVRQAVSLPAGGTVGGALAVGVSAVSRLGHGPVRDVLLQARYVSAAGQVVKAGGPTVKNVSGFDLCRLLVGSRGALGFLGDVILRTRPLPQVSQWFSVPSTNPFAVFAGLYRPASVLWNGSTVWALLEGHPADVAAQAAASALQPCDGPPALPGGCRSSVPPASITSLTGVFVTEVGIGVVHHAEPRPPAARSARASALAAAVKAEFDPTMRLNPGVAV